MHDPLYPGVSGTENGKPQMSRVVHKSGLGGIVLNAWRSTLTSRNIRATTNDQTCENTKQDFLILAYIVHRLAAFLTIFLFHVPAFPQVKYAVYQQCLFFLVLLWLPLSLATYIFMSPSCWFVDAS